MDGLVGMRPGPSDESDFEMGQRRRSVRAIYDHDNAGDGTQGDRADGRSRPRRQSSVTVEYVKMEQSDLQCPAATNDNLFVMTPK